MRVFSEIQRFNQWWMQLINIGLLGFLLFSFYNWYIAKEPTGNVTPTDTVGQIVVIVSIIPALLLLYSIKLKTSNDEIGIHYQFTPFHFSRKTIRWNEIEKCYVRTYNPIKEYGGWGYRTSFGKKKGSAFNVKGNILAFNWSSKQVKSY
ncbi:hypothetical protein [Maribacter halichondriae]|uniref:hypothetical protein n=1 Tax=Maribacter halichondriae TaxID=2980554 RepID=UPI002358A20E|nr:hypothetical protein [Maribacter sp. Hal144]